MSYFSKFKQVLSEAPEDPVLDLDGDDAALRASMDSTGDPNQYSAGTEGSDQEEVIAKIKSRVQGWSDEVAEFTNWINGTDPNSLLNQVQAVEKHPAFTQIADKTQKDIAKTATILAGLTQTIYTFINIADRTYAKSKEKDSK